jgi:hypothetical protein
MAGATGAVVPSAGTSAAAAARAIGESPSRVSGSAIASAITTSDKFVFADREFTNLFAITAQVRSSVARS